MHCHSLCALSLLHHAFFYIYFLSFTPLALLLLSFISHNPSFIPPSIFSITSSHSCYKGSSRTPGTYFAVMHIYCCLALPKCIGCEWIITSSTYIKPADGKGKVSAVRILCSMEKLCGQLAVMGYSMAHLLTSHM